MTIDSRHHLRRRGLGASLEFLEARRQLSAQLAVIEPLAPDPMDPGSSNPPDGTIVRVEYLAAALSEPQAHFSGSLSQTGLPDGFRDDGALEVSEVGTEREDLPDSQGANSVVSSPAQVPSGSGPVEPLEASPPNATRVARSNVLLETGTEELFESERLRETPAAHPGASSSKPGVALLSSKNVEGSEISAVSSREDFVARGALTVPPPVASPVTSSMTPISRDAGGRSGGETRLNLVPESDSLVATVVSLTRGAIWTANAADTLRTGMTGAVATSAWQVFLPMPVLRTLSSAASLVNGEFEGLRGLDIPVSRGSEMLGSFSPFEGTLEKEFDDFLQGIVEMDLGLQSLGEPTTIVPGVVAAALTFSLAEFARRKVRRAWDDRFVPHVIDEDSSLPGLPGLPGGWDSEEP